MISVFGMPPRAAVGSPPKIQFHSVSNLLEERVGFLKSFHEKDLFFDLFKLSLRFSVKVSENTIAHSDRKKFSLSSGIIFFLNAHIFKAKKMFLNLDFLFFHSKFVCSCSRD